MLNVDVEQIITLQNHILLLFFKITSYNDKVTLLFFISLEGNNT